MHKILTYFKNQFPKALESKKFFNCFIFIILILALLLRLKIINTQGVTLIESFTLFDVITKTNMIEMIEADDSIPPLQYLIFRFISWFSTELFWLRMPNLIFFTVIFFIIFELTRKQGKLSALIALILLSFSPYQLEYSWESYVYLLFQFWGAVNLYSLYKLVMEKLKKNQFTFWSVIFIISNVCGFFTHYSHIWFILAEILYLIFLFFKAKFYKIKLNKKYKKIFILLLITVFILVLYLPIFNLIYHTALVNISWFERLNIFDIGYNFLVTLGVYDLWHYGITNHKHIKIFGSILFLIFSLISIWRLKNFKHTNLISDLGFFLALSSIVFVYFISEIIGQSILEEKTLVILSLIVVINLSQIIIFGLKQKLLIKIITISFSCLLTFHYINQSMFYIKNQFYTGQITTLNLVKLAKKEKISAMLFLKPGDCAYPQDKDGKNHRELDYYWFGHDRLFQKPAYTLITDENFNNFYQKKDYWIVGYGCNSQKSQLAADQCLNVGKQYLVELDGLLIECLNEVDND